MKKIPPKTWVLETGEHLENFQMPLSLYFYVSFSLFHLNLVLYIQCDYKMLESLQIRVSKVYRLRIQLLKIELWKIET